ncbi:MAG: peroxide stress protein YaaA [Actinomycetota bacterium]|nr:peroxide stress protein YaaA [Actinomycetota bacterium]
MLIVVSPAKSLDFDSKLPTRKHSEAVMLDRSAELVSVMVHKSPEELASMMSISSELAELNFERFQDWEPPFTPKNARPAALAFNGDTYIGLDAHNSFSERDFTHSQKTLRILSGLYGVLRPLDLIQPYRLEMGSKVTTDRGDTLYDFWGDEISDRLNADLADSPGAAVLVNCASNEYFGSVNPNRIDGRVITPRFLDAKDGGPYKMIGFFAKRARGAMAAWIIQNRANSAKSVLSFDRLGYSYSADHSEPGSPAFIRDN